MAKRTGKRTPISYFSKFPLGTFWKNNESGEVYQLRRTPMTRDRTTKLYLLNRNNKQTVDINDNKFSSPEEWTQVQGDN